ncbi:MAG TPA: hypothetical protein VGG98_05640 [Solirubrobacteraceae bacterium]|jgi:hypothetical protein
MTKDKLKHIRRVAAIVAGSVGLGVLIGGTPAAAEVQCGSCTPWWHLNSGSLPADLPPGGEGKISVIAEDLGDAGLHSSVVLTDKLPAGLTAQSVDVGLPVAPEIASLLSGFCAVVASEVTCAFPAEIVALSPLAYSHVALFINVSVAANAQSGGTNHVSISGGGALSTAIDRPIRVDGTPARFGIEQYEMLAENADGSPDTQAGSHPFQLTTMVGLNQGADPRTPPAGVKDLHVNLPPGLIGNPTPFPQCPLVKFLGAAEDGQNNCADNTVVGVASVTATFPVGNAEPVETIEVPLFALVPTVGEPARFGFDVAGVSVFLDTSLRTGGDYGVTVSIDNITQISGFVSSRVTFWGVPGDPRHDAARGWNCLKPTEGSAPCAVFGQESPPPLLTLPTACTGPVHTTVEGDSWQEAGVFTPPFDYTFRDNLGRVSGMDGCNQLPFSPSIKVTPDGRAGSTPTGLTVDEHVPQDPSLNSAGLAESSVKGLSVTLPAGVVLNPAAADGLQACSQDQIGLQSPAAPSCPEASKVATVKIKTPLLANALEGAAYLASQNANPFGSLVALYIYAEDPVSGIRAKAAGEVLENPVTGQLTAHFEGDPVFQHDPHFAGVAEAQFLPELPFEDVELHFFGGDRAPLGTPAACGGYTTTGTFTPWSENPTTESSSEFQIVSGPNGSPCANPLPFAPSLTAGTTSIQAGGFSPFVTTFSRDDGQQNLRSLTLHMPPGLLGTLSSVKLCGEAQANAGTCGSESLIGHTTVSVGLGGDPYSVTGGQVFITGPYRGAPFGLSIVNPAKAGPFDLGSVVVRAKIDVDRSTSALTITTDDSGPYAIPSILDGIPLQIKHVNVNIDRAGFTFNPTNCQPLAITGTINSSEGASRTLSVPLQVTNCATLAFKPKLTATTTGKTSRANGASLAVKLTYPAGPFDANISRVKVDLPKQLPSRLTTLQKACTAAQFAANPAGCPAASLIGHAKAITPVIPVPLEGPAYFVSHGGEAFPSLVIVLQGYGVTVDLVGTTFISSTGITSSTFKTVPDVPVGSFELKLPQGKFSALAANGNLCKSKLSMPTAFLGQNGAVVHTSTPIKVTGCAKAKRKKSARQKKPGRKVTRKKG